MSLKQNSGCAVSQIPGSTGEAETVEPASSTLDPKHSESNDLTPNPTNYKCEINIIVIFSC